ncbi:MAG: hypothetical protein H7A43_10235 [Verrucomicrobia bacterium]|nr:hypothetical protein [Verrucomicrobiota bacterium]
MSGNYTWFIIDGIGPFFRGIERHRVNWSKIPFGHVDACQLLDGPGFEQVVSDFETVCAKAAAAGYTAITLDDVAHLVPDDHYPPEMNRKIERYRTTYRKLFAVAADYGLSILITTDFMFRHPSLDPVLKRSWSRNLACFVRMNNRLLEDFPEIRGVILRVGESDAADAGGDFRSSLMVKSPAQARKLIATLLPVFARHDRVLIFRTWSVGAYRVGDLIWNRDTYDRVFHGLEHPNLIISIKYGESDFFRYLPLSRQFFKGPHQKIVEFQARREYEGCGEYPSFVGWDVAHYRAALESAPGMVGISVWCQTGGWAVFRRLTYLEDAGLWNELNAYVIVQLFREGATVDGALRSFYRQRFGEGRWDKWIELMELSDQVIKELLYVREFAERNMYFRRLRIPPLMTVFWDHLFVNHSMRKVLGCLVLDREASLREAARSMAALDRMVVLAGELGIRPQDIAFQRQTFGLLAAARDYYLRPYQPAFADRLTALKEAYQQAYRIRYAVKLDFRPVRIRRKWFRRFLGLLLRDHRRYRMLDHVFTIRILAGVYSVMRWLVPGLIPRFARERAMGLDVVFK